MRWQIIIPAVLVITIPIGVLTFQSLKPSFLMLENQKQVLRMVEGVEAEAQRIKQALKAQAELQQREIEKKAEELKKLRQPRPLVAYPADPIVAKFYLSAAEASQCPKFIVDSIASKQALQKTRECSFRSLLSPDGKTVRWVTLGHGECKKCRDSIYPDCCSYDNFTSIYDENDGANVFPFSISLDRFNPLEYATVEKRTGYIAQVIKNWFYKDQRPEFDRRIDKAQVYCRPYKGQLVPYVAKTKTRYLFAIDLTEKVFCSIAASNNRGENFFLGVDLSGTVAAVTDPISYQNLGLDFRYLTFMMTENLDRSKEK